MTENSRASSSLAEFKTKNSARLDWQTLVDQTPEVHEILFSGDMTWVHQTGASGRAAIDNLVESDIGRDFPEVSGELKSAFDVMQYGLFNLRNIENT